MRTVPHGSSSGGMTSAIRKDGVATVFIVEPLAAIRDLIVSYCAALAGFRVVGASGSRDDAERECARIQPDLAVVDWLQLADRNESNLAAAIRRVSPGTGIIVFSATTNEHYVSDAIAAGVVGFVVKSSPIEALGRALRAVADGRQYFCPEMSGVLRELLRRSSRGNGRKPALSHREREVLRAIALGQGSKEIAAAFDLSVFSVENIRRRIMRKTSLKSVAELTLHAVGLGLVIPPGGLPRDFGCGSGSE